MKIVSKTSCEPEVVLGDATTGDVVRINITHSTKHKKEDPFFVISLVNRYCPAPGNLARQNDLRAVVNMRTGALAYFNKSKQITYVDAELCLP